MGAAGAGLATLIARIAMPIAMIGYFATSRRVRPYIVLMSQTRLQWRRFGHLMKIGLPIATQMTLESSAFVLSAIMIGWFGTVAIAANQITTTLSNAAFMICIGFSSAATIRVSHAYGARHWPELRMAANASYHIALCWNLFAALMFILLRTLLPQIFTQDEEVIALTAAMLVFAAMFQVVDCIQAISIGILRGMKDVNATMGVAFFAYIVVNLPIGYLFAFPLGMGPEGVWLGYVFGLGLAALLLNRRYRHSLQRLSKRGGPEIL
jgi:MATE family multidrug resistance protein